MKKPNRFLRIMFKICCICAAVIFVVYAAVNIIMLSCAKKYIVSVDEAAGLDADCALVLGAHVFASGRLSDMLADRVSTSVMLHENGAVPKLIMSGDHGTVEYDEVNHMKSYAVEKDVPPEDVFMDHAGFSTYESVYRAQYIFGAEKILIVSQKYHLSRAVFMARAMGMDAYGVPADLRDYRDMPYNYARESLARVKDFFMTVFRPKPTYLGETIDLTGSGAQTDDIDIYNYD